MAFEKVTKYQDVDFPMPVRKTRCAAGYDMAVAEDTVVKPWVDHCIELTNYIKGDLSFTLKDIENLTKEFSARPTLVPTGVKCKLADDEYLELSVRSSTPLKTWLVLANGVGIIDADYYNNESNEGHIYFQMINLSPFPIILKKGDIIGQGIVHKYQVFDNDVASGERTGGFGSTSK